MSLTTADIARAGRTTARGIHIWDREGLLGPVARDRFDQRVFTEEHVRRAKIVAAAQMAGMSLAEIKAAHEVTIASYIGGAREFMKKALAEINLDFDL